MNWWETVLLAALASAGAFFAAWATARSSDRASARTSDVAARVAENEGMDRLVGRLEARLQAVEREAEECRERIDKLDRWKTTATDYIHVLRNALRDAGQAAPPVPSDLDL